MNRPLAVAFTLISVALPGLASAKPPRVAVVQLEGDPGGEVQDVVMAALDGDLSLVGPKEVNRTVDKLGLDSDMSDKDLKKLSNELEADAIVQGKVSSAKDDHRLLHFKLFSKGKRLKGFKIEFANVNSDKFKSALHDKMVEKLGGGDGVAKKKKSSDDDDADAKTTANAKKKKGKGGDDDDADAKTTANAKKKKGKGGDDDDADAKVATTSKKKGKGGDDDDADAKTTAKKKKGKGGDDDDADAKSSKKKGKGGDDDDADAKVAASSKKKKGGDDDTTDGPPKKGGGGDDDTADAKPAKKSDDDSGDDTKSAKKKRTAHGGDDDDTSVTASVEVGPKGSTVRAANRAAVRVDVGPSIESRNLSFNSRTFAEAPKGYKNSPVPGARVEGELHPFGFSDPKSPAAGLGLYGFYDRTIGLALQNSAQPGTKFDVNEMHWEIGANYRIVLGSTATSPSVALSVGYGHRVFGVDRHALNVGTVIDIPDVEYVGVDPGVEFRIPIVPSVAFVLGGQALLLLRTGEVQQTDYYGQAKVTGGQGMAGLDVMISSRMALRFTGELCQIGFKLTGNGSMSNDRDGVPGSPDVGGITDRYIGGAATLAVLY